MYYEAVLKDLIDEKTIKCKHRIKKWLYINTYIKVFQTSVYLSNYLIFLYVRLYKL